MKKIPLFIIMVAVLGCSTAYQEMSVSGGYYQQKKAEDLYVVGFRGNGFTGHNTVKDYALLRSAEICHQLGYTHFTVDSWNDSSRKETLDMGSTSYTSGSIHGYGSSASYYGTTNTSRNQYPVFKPHVILTVHFFDGEPEGKHLEIYVAETVINNIKSKYRI